MADGLNAMTVRVQHGSAVVVGMILWPQPRRTTVAPATGKRRRMKSVYRLAIGSAKTQMCARNWRFDLIRASFLAEVIDAYKPERAQSCVIETAAIVEVGDACRHMIQHGLFPSGRLQRKIRRQ
jgi:hypothetical protein